MHDAIRITVASNVQQRSKAPLLIPASTTLASAIKALVFKTASSKLRIKKPSRVYAAKSGQELLTDDDWEKWIDNDATLLVSAGEEYVGLKREDSRHAQANPSCPTYILAERAPVDHSSIIQVTTTAHTLPGIIYGVGQPDLHPGTKFPIGAVFVSKGWIHPPLIGGDIGCGMAWYKTKLSRSQVDGDKGRKIAEKLRRLEGAWRSQPDREYWLRDAAGSCSAGVEWDASLGTIGAGNHFAEIQVVEESCLIGDSSSVLEENDVILLVHSGSRGFGGSVFKKYTSESRVSLEEGSEKMKAYMAEHDQACRWAKANRDLIAVRFLSCLEPGETTWEVGRNASNVHTDAETILQARAKIQERKVVDIWHNNVERVKWPPLPLPLPSPPPPPSPSSAYPAAIPDPEVTAEKLRPESSGTRQVQEQDWVYIHRKGAAPVHTPKTTNPLALLPLPGSRGTPTLILVPTFSPSTSYGALNALSLAHGAGRSMSRAKALSSLGHKYKGQNLVEPGMNNGNAGKDEGGHGQGTWVICDEKDLVFEEAPEAYKDVHAVGEDLVREGVAVVAGWCRARVSYKVRNDEGSV
ncbi:hypothetical protein K504DRAFT_385614 [Pleomassaria siparia CBS 279.74]|uniref:3'-phosphate/5'-hydroxy nucleic acid ligase n=1 Tax=Pleomassaria siparia CBS 279.74 TaxID=1314801 RepID=A0A6G1K2Z5_9PLEO|nr:hypothetical protein K504DRAFT_385614 [Pleomassaria siparia CBS 279.74]